jgi:uncharacterized protein (TIGR00299 family) protein
LIEKSGISEGAKRRAIAIFTKIAEAEAQVHGTTPEAVAFHEVGAMDSIIDIVGTAICLDMLAPARITANAVELGGGVVHCAHGVLPVPAPATLLLVKGLPVRTGGFDKEMTTPTGAGIIAASVDAFVESERFTEIKTGCGIGQRVMDKPNILRVSWRDAETAAGTPDGSANFWHSEEVDVLETNIDDMTGEALGFLMDCLFEAGALDVTFASCVMKKSRPGTIISVLAKPDKVDALTRVLFERSSTVGLRISKTERRYLRRESGAADGMRTKTSFLDNGKTRVKIEADDRAKAAREKGCSLDEV